MQSQLSLVYKFFHEVSHKQHPWYHQQEREDKRDGLQIPGKYRDASCQSDSLQTKHPDRWRGLSVSHRLDRVRRTWVCWQPHCHSRPAIVYKNRLIRIVFFYCLTTQTNSLKILISVHAVWHLLNFFTDIFSGFVLFRWQIKKKRKRRREHIVSYSWSKGSQLEGEAPLALLRWNMSAAKSCTPGQVHT